MINVAVTRTVNPDGSYELAYWQDADGNPVARAVARRVEIVRYGPEGQEIENTLAWLGEPIPEELASPPPGEGPAIEPAEPPEFDPRRWWVDADDVELGGFD